ncbi:EpsG family protein [Weissella diestrammenae]|uniref:EpsG family protein n=1 Tax=Weissella diestrammenae TaxID=1162633 RepID=A0A7G9T6N6_9LACO|nr:EpsG family protein [Weissella diestrammenae]MCM0582954.1 EpsG family protein [Weissella diestrammenae]QNN75761.1 EpsG family protein [Weissella diestrammenae]
MVPYYVLFLILISVGFVNWLMYFSFDARNGQIDQTVAYERRYTVYLCFCGLCLILFAGLRGGEVGTDTGTYQGVFENRSMYMEPGFVWLQNTVAQLGLNFDGFKVVVSALTIAPILWVIRQLSPYKLFSLYLFIAMYLYLYSFNIMRQYLAMSVVVISVYILAKMLLSRLWQYTMFAITAYLAFNFHRSSIIFIPFLFLATIKTSFRQRQMLLWVALLILVCLPPISMSMLERIPGVNYIFKLYDPSEFFAADRESAARYLIAFGKGGILWPLLYLNRQVTFPNRTSRVLYQMGLGLLFAYALKFNAPALTRMMQYADALLVIILPVLIATLESKVWRTLLLGLITLFFLINLFFGFYMNVGGIVPYYSGDIVSY